MSFMERERGRCAPTTLLELTPSMRGLIEDAIESLVLLLDEIDGDPDEEDHREDDEQDGSAEPVLGSLEQHPCRDCGSVRAWDYSDQRKWGQSGTSDEEGEHDGREPDVDDEPSLGSYDRHEGQTFGAMETPPTWKTRRMTKTTAQPSRCSQAPRAERTSIFGLREAQPIVNSIKHRGFK